MPEASELFLLYTIPPITPIVFTVDQASTARVALYKMMS